jgi:pyruvate dehydrogenase E2 component (dihydrolipoamide acetyltransferase)
MDEGTFAGWLKQPGDQVRPGDRLFILESDKAAEEIETLDGGTLQLSPDAPRPGDKVKVGQVLAYLLADGETVPEGGRKPDKEIQTDLSFRAERAQPARKDQPRRRRAISPRARRVATELGIDCSGLAGTGRNCRIRERDVREAAAGKTQGRLIPHTTIRRTIAARMVAGVSQAAPVTLTTRADATNLVNLRQQFKEASATPDDLVPGYTDFLLKLTAAALRQHPLLQAQWREEGLFVPDRIDLALAVQTSAGLLAPVVRQVDRLSLREVAANCREVIAQARAGRLTAEQMRDATFTVTNLGGLGIDSFTPIIHLPQCAVLGLGRIVREPVVFSGGIVARDMVTLSLTFDHRVVDGSPAAEFLATLRRCLEHPAPWLIS